MSNLAELAKSARDNLQNISSLVAKYRTPQGQPFFSEIDYAMRMVQRIDLILRRMLKTNSQAHEIDIALYKAMPKTSGPAPENISLMLNQLDELRIELEMDFESLYRYGTILLDSAICNVNSDSGTTKN